MAEGQEQGAGQDLAVAAEAIADLHDEEGQLAAALAGAFAAVVERLGVEHAVEEEVFGVGQLGGQQAVEGAFAGQALVAAFGIGLHAADGARLAEAGQEMQRLAEGLAGGCGQAGEGQQVEQVAGRASRRRVRRSGRESAARRGRGRAGCARCGPGRRAGAGCATWDVGRVASLARPERDRGRCGEGAWPAGCEVVVMSG